jgi:hypothetical protein
MPLDGFARWIRKGAATIVPTVCLGFSDEYGSWKTIWMFRCTSAMLVVESFERSLSSKVICPEVDLVSHCVGEMAGNGVSCPCTLAARARSSRLDPP